MVTPSDSMKAGTDVISLYSRKSRKRKNDSAVIPLDNECSSRNHRDRPEYGAIVICERCRYQHFAWKLISPAHVDHQISRLVTSSDRWPEQSSAVFSGDIPYPYGLGDGNWIRLDD